MIVMRSDNSWIWRSISKRRMSRGSISLCGSNCGRHRHWWNIDWNYLRQIDTATAQAVWPEIQSQSRDLPERFAILLDIPSLWSERNSYHRYRGSGIFVWRNFVSNVFRFQILMQKKSVWICNYFWIFVQQNNQFLFAMDHTKIFRSFEGDIMNQFQQPLKLQDNGRIHIIFPVTVCHIIDSESPLYTLSASQFLEKR